MKVAILGSTGSIGRNALTVVDNLRGKVRIYALSARNNITLLYKQVLKYAPAVICVEDTLSAKKIKTLLKKRKKRITILRGTEGLRHIASHRAIDTVLISLVGAAGFSPLLSAIQSKKRIALANKESLVMAGDLIMREAQRMRVPIIPVDSEHSAIFQCLRTAEKKEIKRIVLTASGGPFYKKKKSLKHVSVEEALAHPNWKMGKKITIDSATLMNKGLEAIEAHHLFNVPMEKIQVLIHPQSIIHSMVEFIDGSVLAQLSNPDMCLPIQYALTFPRREKGIVRALKLEDIQKLEFYTPDFSRFPCLSLAYKAAKTGGSMPAVLNASNEVAVAAFLDEKISLDKIPLLVSSVMKKHTLIKKPNLQEILSVDAWAREAAAELTLG